MKTQVNRRIAIKKVSFLVGGAVATPTLLSVLQSCQQAKEPLTWSPQFLNEDQARLVTRLAEMIIPKTDTPGAVEAGVPAFMDKMLQLCLKPEAQSMFVQGLNDLQNIAQENHQSDFLDLEADQQNQALKQVAEAEHKNGDTAQSEEEDQPKKFFKQLKELTLLGYFTSEMGATQALEYLQIPGSYQGCTTLEPNQKAWAVD